MKVVHAVLSALAPCLVLILSTVHIRSMESGELPEDVTLQILSLLPVKSILRFKCVSKSWRALVEDSGFIAQHLNNSKENDSVLVEYRDEKAKFCLLSGKAFEQSANLDLSHYFKEYTSSALATHFVASCNGIICLFFRKGIALWNPATRQLKDLHNDFHHAISIGFGFDAKTNDYKVVKLDGHKPDSVEVYSLCTDTWRTIDVVMPYSKFSAGCNGKYQNGTYYWSAGFWKDEEEEEDVHYIILSFDMSSETLRMIPMPGGLGYCRSMGMCVSTAVLNDSIAVTCLCDGQLSVWLLKEDGIKESWLQLYSWISIPGWDCPGQDLLYGTSGFSYEGDLFLRSSGGLVVCNLATLKRKKVKIDKVSIKSACIEPIYYKESLVPVIFEANVCQNQN